MWLFLYLVALIYWFPKGKDLQKEALGCWGHRSCMLLILHAARKAKLTCKIVPEVQAILVQFCFILENGCSWILPALGDIPGERRVSWGWALCEPPENGPSKRDGKGFLDGKGLLSCRGSATLHAAPCYSWLLTPCIMYLKHLTF